MKLQEIAKGNCENLDNHSLEELLNQKLSHFTRHSGMTQRYSQDMPIGKENAGMMRAEPQAVGRPPKKRLKSANERTMMNSKARPKMCSLCIEGGHILGQTCPLVGACQAKFYGFGKTEELMHSLGKPGVWQIENPKGAVKDAITDWMVSEASVPKAAQHMVITNCF